MEIDVPITGTTYRSSVYKEWCENGANPSALTLQRLPNNNDDFAVQIQYYGQQMGWVGQTHSEKVAKYIDAGSRASVERVMYHAPTQSDMKRLVVRLSLTSKGMPAPPGKPKHIVKVFGSVSHAVPLDYIRRSAVGTVLACRTDSGRTSISLTPLNATGPGADLAWFRKEEPGAELPNELIMWANRGALVARIETQNPLTMSLHRKGDIKEPEMAFTHDLKTFTSTQPTTQKENTMNIANATTNFIESNKSAAAQAGFLEAGRIANNQVVKISAKALPMMVRGYADTPIGKLLVANIAQMAAQQLRPQDPTLKKLTTAMTVAAYQEVIQTVDIEGWLNTLLESPEIQRAIGKLPSDAPKAQSSEAAQVRKANDVAGAD